MSQFNTRTVAKEKDVLPPFDPPAPLLSMGEWTVNAVPASLFGIILLCSLVFSNGRSDDLFLVGCLLLAFLANGTIVAAVWREVRELRQELHATRQQLAHVEHQQQN